MQTEPSLNLTIKLADHEPILVIEKEAEAKAPEFFLSNITESTPFSEKIQLVIDGKFINQLKA